MPLTSERRYEFRHERGDLSLAICVDGREISSNEQTLVDISHSGLGIYTVDVVEVGQTVDFRLDGGQVAGRGCVQWVDARGGGFRCGVKTSLGVLDKIRLWRLLDPHPQFVEDYFDKILYAAACGVAVLATAKYLGFQLASLPEIIQFYSKFF